MDQKTLMQKAWFYNCFSNGREVDTETLTKSKLWAIERLLENAQSVTLEDKSTGIKVVYYYKQGGVMERLVEILKTMELPKGRLDVTDDSNIQWLGRNIWFSNRDNPDLQEALQLLKKHGARLTIGLEDKSSAPWEKQIHTWSGVWTSPEKCESIEAEILAYDKKISPLIKTVEVVFVDGTRYLYTRTNPGVIK